MEAARWEREWTYPDETVPLVREVKLSNSGDSLSDLAFAVR